MYHILTQFEGSIQRTIVYQTRYENNIAFIQQRKDSQSQAGLPSIIASYPKNFVDFVTTLPNITEEEDFINNSTPWEIEITSQHIPNPLTSDIGSWTSRVFCEVTTSKVCPSSGAMKNTSLFQKIWKICGKSSKHAELKPN